MVKAQHQHQLARLERQREVLSRSAATTGAPRMQRTPKFPPRSAAAALATALLLLSLIAGAAFAAAPAPGAAPGAGHDMPAGVGGGGVQLLR